MTTPKPSTNTQLLPILLLGIALGIIALIVILGTRERSVTEAGLGINTTSGIRPHAVLGDFEYDSPADLALDRGMKRRNLPRRALWLGASQLYGINNRKAGDRTAGFKIYETLVKDGIDLGIIGLPNATPQEHFVLLASLAPRIKPALLVLGAVYDDMRHAEIRPAIYKTSQQSPARDLLARFPSGRAILSERGPALPKHAARPVIRRDTSWMHRSEAWLTAQLEAAFGFMTARQEGRGLVILSLQKLRRFFELQRFKFTRNISSYRVPIPLESYRTNLKAWGAMFELAAARKIKVLVYIAPRPADFFPYDATGYANYKRDLRQLANRYDARLISIEDAVPPQHWGEVDITFGFPVRDPFHFKGTGHALMAKALLPEIRRALRLHR